MSKASLVTRRFAELSHISTVLPSYASRCAGPAYSWLTVDYLREQTAPAEAYFAKVAELETGVTALAASSRAAEVALTRLARGGRRMLQTVSALTEDEHYSKVVCDPRTDLIGHVAELVMLLTECSTGNQSINEFVNAGKLCEALVAARAAYFTARNALEASQLALTEQKKHFVLHEDALDDLWHTVTNALDGLFHEEKEILYTFMPWRRRTKRKVGVASVPPTEVTSTPEAQN